MVKIVKLQDLGPDVLGDVNTYEVDECYLNRTAYQEVLSVSGYRNLRIQREVASDFVDLYVGSDEDETVALNTKEINALIDLLEEARDWS